MWRPVDLVWTDVSEERIASIFRVGKSRTRNQREQVASRFTRRHIRDDGILQIYFYKLLGYKSYMEMHKVLCTSYVRSFMTCLWSAVKPQPPTWAKECISFLWFSFQHQTSKGVNASRNTVVVKQCSEIKHISGNDSTYDCRLIMLRGGQHWHFCRPGTIKSLPDRSQQLP
jgi:hypothetical protein